MPAFPQALDCSGGSFSHAEIRTTKNNCFGGEDPESYWLAYFLAVS
jgi:hypothetical protein